MTGNLSAEECARLLDRFVPLERRAEAQMALAGALIMQWRADGWRARATPCREQQKVLVEVGRLVVDSMGNEHFFVERAVST